MPMAFVKYDIESQGPYRNKYGRCVPIGTGKSYPEVYINAVKSLTLSANGINGTQYNYLGRIIRFQLHFYQLI